jgi:putative tricarboxylic transport membrane protein
MTRPLPWLLCAALLAALPAAQAQWKPTRTVEIVVFSAPGGGNDKTARVMQKIWTENKMLEAVVVNKVGGGGSLAYAYGTQKTGDPHVLVLAQAGLITNRISGLSPISYTDLTPIAFVGSEPVGLTVRADAPYKNLKEFAAQLKKDPQSLSISTGSTRGAVNHFAVAMLAKAVGVDPKPLKILTFGGGAEATTNLLGGHIQATSLAINNAIPHHKAGRLRILALSTPQRSPGLPDVPTFREQGFDVLMEGWTIYMAPKGLTPAQVAYWEDLFAKTVQHPEWKQYLESNSWEWGYKNSRESAEYLRKDDEQTRALLTELGMAK